MRKQTVIGILAVSLFCSTPAFSSLKSGWDKGKLKKVSKSCTSVILKVIDRNPDLVSVPSDQRTRNPYKTKDFKPSVTKLCKCVTKQMATNVAYEHFAARPASDLSYDFRRALFTGRCKPTGLLSKIR